MGFGTVIFLSENINIGAGHGFLIDTVWIDKWSMKVLVMMKATNTIFDSCWPICIFTGVGNVEPKQPYGLHPFFKNAASSATVSVEKAPQTYTPLSDRVAATSATVVAFMAENNLPFTMAPKLCHFAQEVGRDKKALDKLKISRTTAAYQMEFGVAKTMEEEIISDLQSTCFSLNIDEATSKTFHRVLSILVSYHSSSQQEIVVKHLASISLVKVNSESISQAIDDLFSTKGIPWRNLVSVLMDSCAVMRGSKTGVEARLREKAPHLLDVDGDSCHHAHNAAKKFCSHFNNEVEHLFRDIHNDLQYSADLRKYLEEVCIILGVKYTMPEEYAPHRWLSIYNVTVDGKRMLDPLLVMYYGFLKTDDTKVYLDVLSNIYKQRSINTQAKKRISSIHAVLQKKKMTDDGKRRKERIIHKLFYKAQNTKLIMNVYISVLPLLKSYTVLFQSKEPLVHKLHETQKKLVRDFLSCFLKPEAFTDTPVTQLKVDEKCNHLPLKMVFLGRSTEATLKSLSKEEGKLFRVKVLDAYIDCASVLLSKMPLRNRCLRLLSAIDPETRGTTRTLSYMKDLPGVLTNVLSEEDHDEYYKEVRQFHTDESLPPLNEGQRIDHWWTKVLVSGKYNTLSKMVMAALSIFSGPHVESSFSVMSNIMQSKSSRLQVETFSSLQTIKYSILAGHKPSLALFLKKDFLHEPINKMLVANMRQAREESFKHLANQKSSAQHPLKHPTPTTTKRRALEVAFQVAKKARITHAEKAKSTRSIN